MHRVSDRAGPTHQRLAITPLAVLPSASVDSVSYLNSVITRLNSLACTYRYRRFACTLTGTDARLAVLDLRCKLFHLLLHAGLSRRTYGTVRPRAPGRYSTSRGFLPLRPSLLRPGG